MYIFEYRDWMNPYPPPDNITNDEYYQITIDPTLLNPSGMKIKKLSEFFKSKNDMLQLLIFFYSKAVEVP